MGDGRENEAVESAHPRRKKLLPMDESVFQPLRKSCFLGRKTYADKSQTINQGLVYIIQALVYVIQTLVYINQTLVYRLRSFPTTFSVGCGTFRPILLSLSSAGLSWRQTPAFGTPIPKSSALFLAFSWASLFDMSVILLSVSKNAVFLQPIHKT